MLIPILALLLLFSSSVQAVPRCEAILGVVAGSLTLATTTTSALAVQTPPRYVKIQSPLLQTVAIEAEVVPRGDALLQSTVEVVVAPKTKKGMKPQRPLICTGVYVGPRFVQTAAHCLENAKKSVVTVRFYQSGDDVIDEREVIKFASHPGYERFGDTDDELVFMNKLIEAGHFVSNDVALMKIAGPPPKGFKPAPYLSANDIEKIGIGARVTAAGVGINQYVDVHAKNFTMPAGVKAGVMRVIREMVVRRDLGGSGLTITDPAGKSNLCFGDSGGPAYVWLNNQYYVWGTLWLVSPKCGKGGEAYFLPYFQYKDWLEKTMRAMR